MRLNPAALMVHLSQRQACFISFRKTIACGDGPLKNEP
jgi:hypothetical protein